MISPTISNLLAGVASSLDETVLPELAPGFPRNQLVAAIALIRRAAAVDERIGTYLWQDNRDIAAVLSDIAPFIGLDPPPPDTDASYPTLDALRQRNLALQHRLVDAQETLRESHDGAPARAALRALFERMLAREAQINTSSWV